MRVTAYFEDYVKAIIKEKTQLPIEKIILKEADFDTDTGSIWVEFEIKGDAPYPLYNEKFRLAHSNEEDSGFIYDYQKNMKIYEWG